MLVQYYLKLVRYSGMCGIWYSGTVLLKVGTYSTVFWYVWYTVYGIVVRMVYGIWYSGTCMVYGIWYSGTYGIRYMVFWYVYGCSDWHHLPPLAPNVQQSHDGTTGPDVLWLHACFNSLTCTSRWYNSRTWSVVYIQ